jgi:hypothetical protein
MCELISHKFEIYGIILQDFHGVCAAFEDSKECWLNWFGLMINYCVLVLQCTIRDRMYLYPSVRGRA